ncbi:hypothetical protein A2303_00420 [Candidatus Falkowbacteria bacterium RIFOXYB2_FULL_47_14]|uniref:Phosphoesterase n=1 Tax=Candidatus Falkowbacteria bacterium RIFOXYA2_FULL_47_19 TaxID=1797994 RepID=A0A1F5SLZ3_9BACT|nr:MAG: hypothetical protein A2227_03825 [Candidatus Falkowbacteria bacterium RIFOXYA2_FULL_47_19]OGF37339.1 MAG: hypothetical protein A2468_02185 [Candidatus Falkowbacteria bacterium RIFOXYC2_FULL_46_15]OGF42841.1 MAG: hypothetical protein A2303_00420 [Candidatus Falkowbacteria bacterium RIFOXYB2_FULL_47_14]
MKIVIISDTHDNITNLKKCLDWCRQNDIQEIICCGDVTTDETLEFLAGNFAGFVRLVKGNAVLFDEEGVGKYGNIKYYGRIGRFELDGKMIGVCHEPFLIDYVLRHGPCDLVFYGHTHEPWIEKRGRMHVVNPGTLGGTFSKATFAVWETESGKLELKILEKL